MGERQKIFRFKQFSVINNLAGMKVGTDGVLLGAWAWAGNTASKVLDIGAGCGLISLMIAQRNPRAVIYGIEIDNDAAAEAHENIRLSPWNDRINILHQNVLSYNPKEKYDVIVSNPPFFSNSLLCPDGKRSLARHTSSLPVESLINKAAMLLAADGRFSFVYPADRFEEIETIINSCQLKLTRICRVFTTVDATEPKRVLCECMRRLSAPRDCIMEKICIEISRHQYTKEYIGLTREFYINM